MASHLNVGEIKRASNDQSNPDAFNALTGMTNEQFTNTYDNEFIAAAGLSGLYKAPVKIANAIKKGITTYKFNRLPLLETEEYIPVVQKAITYKPNIPIGKQLPITQSDKFPNNLLISVLLVFTPP